MDQPFSFSRVRTVRVSFAGVTIILVSCLLVFIFCTVFLFHRIADFTF